MDLQEKAERIRRQRRQLGHVCGSNPCPGRAETGGAPEFVQHSFMLFGLN